MISGKHNVFHHHSVQRGRADSHVGRTPAGHRFSALTGDKEFGE